MPLTLSDQDIDDLNAMLADFRHKEACIVAGWLNQKISRQRMKERDAETAGKSKNGADNQMPQ